MLVIAKQRVRLNGTLYNPNVPFELDLIPEDLNGIVVEYVEKDKPKQFSTKEHYDGLLIKENKKTTTKKRETKKSPSNRKQKTQDNVELSKDEKNQQIEDDLLDLGLINGI